MTQEHYVALNGKYLQDADRLLSQEDYPQASEKLWGAVATMLKAVAAGRRWRHSSHRHLGDVVKALRRESGDDDYVALFRSAERLHANFYEGRLDAESVGKFAEEAGRLIEKLRTSRAPGDPQ